MAWMSSRPSVTINSNNNNKTNNAQAYLPSKCKVPPMKRETASFYSGYKESTERGTRTSLCTANSSKPPPPYAPPKLGSVPAPWITPRERRKHEVRTGQSTDPSRQWSPSTMPRSQSTDQICRTHDAPVQQHATSNFGNEQQKSVDKSVSHRRTGHLSTPGGSVTQGQGTTHRSRGEGRGTGSARHRSHSADRTRAAITSPTPVQHDYKELQNQTKRESRGREQTKTPPLRRSHSLNRTSPRVHSEQNVRQKNGSVFPHTFSNSSPVPVSDSTTSRQHHGLPPDSSVTGDRTSREMLALPEPLRSSSSQSSGTPTQRSNSFEQKYTTPAYSTTQTLATSVRTDKGFAQSPISPASRHNACIRFPESGGKVGISNLGNTCFMNSMLQCLGQTGEMAQIFLQMKNPSSSQGLVRAYCELMQQMWSGSDGSSRCMTGSLYPRALKDSFSRKNPQFSGFNQHDSQEFMRFLVSGLHEDLKKSPQKRPDVPTDEDAGKWWQWYKALESSDLFEVFVGQLCSSLKCCKCKKTSLTFDPFWELSVSLPKRPSSTSSSTHCKPSDYYSYSSTHSYSTHYRTSYSSSYSNVTVSLQDCLDVFTKEEKLGGDDRPYCDSCKSQQECIKSMTIQRLPQVLVIHLKRFSGYGRRSKLDTSVTIPHTLNVHKYTSRARGGTTDRPLDHPGTEYELYAVSNHSGTVYFGHYTAWCKHYSTNKWYSYNDSQVSPVTVQSPTFSSSTAYVLFYRQKKRVTAC